MYFIKDDRGEGQDKRTVYRGLMWNFQESVLLFCNQEIWRDKNKFGLSLCETLGCLMHIFFFLYWHDNYYIYSKSHPDYNKVSRCLMCWNRFNSQKLHIFWASFSLLNIPIIYRPGIIEERRLAMLILWLFIFSRKY